MPIQTHDGQVYESQLEFEQAWDEELGLNKENALSSPIMSSDWETPVFSGAGVQSIPETTGPPDLPEGTVTGSQHFLDWSQTTWPARMD